MVWPVHELKGVVAKERTFTYTQPTSGTLVKLTVPFLKYFRGSKVKNVKTLVTRSMYMAQYSVMYQRPSQEVLRYINPTLHLN